MTGLEPWHGSTMVVAPGPGPPMPHVPRDNAQLIQQMVDNPHKAKSGPAKGGVKRSNDIASAIEAARLGNGGVPAGYIPAN